MHFLVNIYNTIDIHWLDLFVLLSVSQISTESILILPQSPLIHELRNLRPWNASFVSLMMLNIGISSLGDTYADTAAVIRWSVDLPLTPEMHTPKCIFCQVERVTMGTP
jgi:hypothetical protein